MELVLVNLLHVADRGAADSTWLVVFPDEGAHHITELGLVAVFHVHLGHLLEGSNFVRKHHVCVLSDQLCGCFEDKWGIGDFLDDFDGFDWVLFHACLVIVC